MLLSCIVHTFQFPSKGLCNNYQEGGLKNERGALHKIAAKIVGGLKVKSLI